MLSDEKMWMKRLVNVLSDGLAMWREWRIVGECAKNCSVSRLWKKWIDTLKDCLKKEVWMSGK